MQVIRNRPGEPGTAQPRPTVVTIGNFDGVHLGHQALIRRCGELAGADESVAVLTFEPLPQVFFSEREAPARLSTVYQKLALLRANDVDVVWLMRFNLALSRLSAHDFAQQVLARDLLASHVVVGADFRFGHKREGDAEALLSLGTEFGFEVDIVPAVFAGNERISSTVIRRDLAEGKFDHAGKMLGRKFRMEGHVVMGQQLGRNLGYPTANLRIRARPSPLQGIFAVYVRQQGRQQGPGPEQTWMPAVSSIGWRPTVGGTEPLLEAHIFDFSGDLYGRRLEVEFVAKLRDESHFSTIEDLVAQMRIDEAEARTVLEQTQRPA